MACAVLKVAGLIDTDHPKLIELQSQHRDLGRILRKPNVERTALDKMGLTTKINAAAKDIVDFAADIVEFSCTMAGTNKWLRDYVYKCDVIAVEEATTAWETEIMIAWKVVKPSISTGDPAQFSTVVFAERLKHSFGERVMAFPQCAHVSSMIRMMDLGWLYIELNEQLRMGPSQFDMTNTLCYANSVIDGPNINLQDERFRMTREVEGFIMNSCITCILRA
jgi:hypothetical protein